MEKVNDLTVHMALLDILEDWEDRHSKSLNYAFEYAKAGLYMHGEELATQCLYVLNNITHWRGTKAKKVRQVLKSYVKDNK